MYFSDTGCVVTWTEGSSCPTPEKQRISEIPLVKKKKCSKASHPLKLFKQFSNSSFGTLSLCGSLILGRHWLPRWHRYYKNVIFIAFPKISFVGTPVKKIWNHLKISEQKKIILKQSETALTQLFRHCFLVLTHQSVFAFYLLSTVNQL